jgi:hypothetical protein
MRKDIIAFCVLVCSVFATTLYADESEPLLLKPPLPPGLIFPKATYLPSARLSGEDMKLPGDHIVCLVLDIGTDGLVSNIKLLKSSGFPAIDSAIAGLAERSRYEPATLNGTPIAVRILSQRILTTARLHNPEGLEGVCSWDMLKVPPSETNAPQPAAN